MAIPSPRASTTQRVRTKPPIDWYDPEEHRRKIAEALVQDIEILDNLVAWVTEHASVALYGSMYTSATSGLYTLGAGWTKYTDFDSQAVTPKGTTFNTTTDSFQINANGIYMFYVGFTFDHDESNSGRTFDMRIFNNSDSTVVFQPITIGVGRNTPYTNFSYQFMFDIQNVNEDDDLIIELGNGSSVTGNFNEFEVGVYSIGAIQGTNGLLVDPAA